MVLPGDRSVVPVTAIFAPRAWAPSLLSLGCLDRRRVSNGRSVVDHAAFRRALVAFVVPDVRNAVSWGKRVVRSPTKAAVLLGFRRRLTSRGEFETIRTTMEARRVQRVLNTGSVTEFIMFCK